MDWTKVKSVRGWLPRTESQDAPTHLLYFVYSTFNFTTAEVKKTKPYKVIEINGCHARTLVFVLFWSSIYNNFVIDFIVFGPQLVID